MKASKVLRELLSVCLQFGLSGPEFGVSSGQEAAGEGRGAPTHLDLVFVSSLADRGHGFLVL